MKAASIFPEMSANRPLDLLPWLSVEPNGHDMARWQHVLTTFEESNLSAFRKSGADQILSTKHLFSAAYPRMSSRSTRREGSPYIRGETSQEMIARLYGANRDADYLEGPWNNCTSEPLLCVGAQRWTSQSRNPDAVTAVLVHASGMHKEVRSRRYFPFA